MTTHLIVLIAGLILYSCVHSLLLAPRVRRLLEKLVPHMAYRLFYNVVATVLLGALWNATDARYPVLWDLQGLPALLLRIVQAGAVLLFLVALRPIDLLHFLGWRQLQGHAEERHGLVTHGAYALCRHPLYFALSCGTFGLAFLANNWIALGAALLQLIPALCVGWMEDRELVGRTGRAHEEYIQTTGALLPKRDVLGFLRLLFLGLLPGGGRPD